MNEATTTKGRAWKALRRLGFALLVGLPLGPVLRRLAGLSASDSTAIVFVGVSLVAGAGTFVASMRSERAARIAGVGAEALAVVVLPLGGLVVNHFERRDCCLGPGRILERPGAFSVGALYLVCLLGYAVARRRPGPLRPLTEALVHASLLSGTLLCMALTLQVGVGNLFLGLWASLTIGIPHAMVVMGPVLALVAFASVAAGRLVRRGREHSRAGWAMTAALPFLRAWAVLHRLTFHAWPHQTFLQTCGWTFSQLPQTCGDHYLCTVAARGHTWLVRPERVGRRGGLPILVNRQLATANAFEDLLHERWPRFGALCRRIYDQCGLPVSRWVRSRWAADAVFLLMKPAELAFALSLLLLDPGEPEERIDRMYRR